MTDALTRAFGNAQRSLLAAKAAVSSGIPDAMMSRGPSGIFTNQPDLAQSYEQLRHFTGWVYTSIRPIAQRIAGQPIHVGRASSAGKLITKSADIREIDNHPLIGVLNDPNGLMVPWSLMFATVASLELTGRQLWYCPKGKSIWPVPTSWIRGFEGTTRFTSFVIQPPHSGEPYPLPADECVLFAYPSPSDPHGAVSPLQAVAGAVDSDEAIITSQAQMFRRGIHPSHALIVGKNPADGAPGGIRPRLSSGQQRQIIEAVRKRYGGVWNNGDPLILDGLIEDVKTLSSTPKEMDYLKSGQFTKERIMQGFGTNAIVCGQIEGANRASSDSADRHFVDYTLNPKISLLSQTMTSWMRYVYNDPTLVVWIEPCVAHDAEMAHQWAETLAKYSAITGDELRALAPFQLKETGFPKPVSGGKPQPSESDDVSLAKSMALVERSLASLETQEKRFNPERIADGIMDDI